MYDSSIIMIMIYTKAAEVALVQRAEDLSGERASNERRILCGKNPQGFKFCLKTFSNTHKDSGFVYVTPSNSKLERFRVCFKLHSETPRR